jgi:hypothetical protein
MRFLWVVLTYACHNGHPNVENLYFKEPIGEVNDQTLHARLPRTLPCLSCPPDTVVFPNEPGAARRVEARSHWLTQEQFDKLGVTAEPWSPELEKTG